MKERSEKAEKKSETLVKKTEDKVGTKEKDAEKKTKEEKVKQEAKSKQELTKEDKLSEQKILTILEALETLRKEKKRKFSQSVDLIINLQDFDIKKNNINLFVAVPNKIKEIKIGAFLEKKSELVDTITKPEFSKYGEKKESKNLIKDYDFFIANGKLMADVATSFGRILGPAGKMPSPQLGVITDESEKSIKTVLDKLSKVVRVKSKEPSIKLTIGKESMKNEDIEENIKIVFNAVLNALPKKKENLKNIMIKFTMSKPIKIEIK